MEKHDITGREDLSKLITRFYARLRKDDLLGPIFNSTIQDWDHHLGHITNFWERNLFGTAQFYGNPGRKHMDVDERQGNSIEKKHFERWLGTWYSTIDDLFVGEKAEEAKTRATTIGANFLRMIHNNRGGRFANPGQRLGGGFQPNIRPEDIAPQS